MEAEFALDAFSLVWSHVLGRGSLPLRPELPPLYIARMKDSPADSTLRVHSMLLYSLSMADLLASN